MPLQKGFRAGGTIRKSRFVKLDVANDSTVLECTTDDEIFGISAEFSRDAPRSDVSTSGVNAALIDDFVRIFGEADVTLLEAGATFFASTDLKSDATGRGIAATAGTDPTGAIALEEATAVGQLVRVQVHLTRNIP